MKKFLLSLAAVALGFSLASAAEVTWDFTTANNTPEGEAPYGLTRYSGTVQPEQSVDDGTTIKEGTCSLLMNKKEGSIGFRLWSDGLRVFKNSDPVMTLTIPGNTITGIDIVWAKSPTSTVSVNGGTAQNMNNANVTLTVTPATEVKLAFTMANNTTIKTMKVTYEATTGEVKQPADLSFDKTSFSILQGTAFTAPELKNPNSLAVTWNSSKEEVATVDAAGKVTVKGIGTTTITATFAGNDKFLAGDAHYTLSVVPSIKKVSDLLKYNTNGDKVNVNCKLYVKYVNGLSVYVTDLYETGWALLYGSNEYKAGDIIPAGWTATCKVFNGLLEYEGSFPAADGNEEMVIFSNLEEVTAANVNTVGWLKDVTFTAATPASKASFTGTWNGNSYTFYNSFAIASVEKGSYDVLVAISYRDTANKDVVGTDNTKVQIYPLQYQAPINLTFPTEMKATSGDPKTDVTCTFYPDDAEDTNRYVVEARSSQPAGTEITIQFVLPAPYNQMIGMRMDGGLMLQQRVPASTYESIGCKILPDNQIKLTVGGDAAIYGVFFGADGEFADQNNAVALYCTAVYDATVGVEAIEAAEGEAEYYNLQGVRVENPEKGVYVKVVNGKAGKVVL